MSESEQDAGRETAAGRAQARREFERSGDVGAFLDAVAPLARRDRVFIAACPPHPCLEVFAGTVEQARVAYAVEFGVPVGAVWAHRPDAAGHRAWRVDAAVVATYRRESVAQRMESLRLDERFMPGGAPDIRHAPLWLSCVAARLVDLARELGCAELSDLAATLRDIGARCDVVPRGGGGS